MKDEAILIFGGGEMQLSLIKNANELGYETIVIDPLENAPGKEIADYFYVVAPKDKEKTIETARRHSVKGIITTQMERPLLFMAEIAESEGFIFPSPKAIKQARDKYLMKQCFNAKGIPCAKGILFNNREEITEKALEHFSFPLIIKPLDAFSSRGVYLCSSIDDLLKYAEETASFSSNGSFLVEEFLDGKEVSVESVTQNGITTVFQITDKEITPYPTAVEMAHIQPSALPADTQNKIKEIVKKSIEALELDNCGSHSEVKITSDGVKMVEVGARLGGDFISSYLTENSTGYSIEQAAIQIAVGREFEFRPGRNSGAVIRYLSLPEGNTISTVNSIKEVERIPGIIRVSLTAKKGDKVAAITDSAKRPGYVITKGDTREEAMKYAEEAVAMIINSIIYED
jgi:carbamoyl-phosphate synthase large subunit